MGVESLDLLVVPWPPGTQGHRELSDRRERQRDGALFLKTWKALRKLVDAGTVRTLGLSQKKRYDTSLVRAPNGGIYLNPLRAMYDYSSDLQNEKCVASLPGRACNRSTSVTKLAASRTYLYIEIRAHLSLLLRWS